MANPPTPPPPNLPPFPPDLWVREHRSYSVVTPRSISREPDDAELYRVFSSSLNSPPGECAAAADPRYYAAASAATPPERKRTVDLVLVSGSIRPVEIRSPRATPISRAHSSALGRIPSCLDEVGVPQAPEMSVDYLNTVGQLEEQVYRHPNFQKHFEGIARADIYKLLFMERSYLEGGKFAYEEEESGYLAAILNGFLFMLDTLDEELTPELMEQLHDNSVKGMRTQEEPNGVPLGFRTYADGAEAFGLEPNGPLPTLSKRGYAEFLERWNQYYYIDETGDKVYFLKQAVVNPRQTIPDPEQPELFRRQPYIALKPTRPETCKRDLQAIIDIYNHHPKESDSDIRRAIGGLCQDKDQRHPYVDGNIRTSGIQLLNRELLRHGQAPCAMADVNQLDCLHRAQVEDADGSGIVEQIREGQQYVAHLSEPSPLDSAAGTSSSSRVADSGPVEYTQYPFSG